MKKTLLTLGLAALSFAGFAQGERSEKGVFTLWGATAAPTGDFGDNSMTNKDAGYAQQGLYYSLEYNHFFNNYFGAGVTIGSRGNQMDTEVMTDYMAQTTGMPFQVDSDPYASGFLMLNAVGKYPITEKLFGYGKVSLGVASSTYPAYTISLLGSSLESEAVTASAGAVGLGAGVRYQFGKFGLGLEVGSLSTKPTFEESGDKLTMQMSSINAGLTLNYVLK